MMSKRKTFAPPIFIFYWLLMISMILPQPALCSGGGRMIGVQHRDSPSAGRATGVSSPPANSAPRGRPSITYPVLTSRPICRSFASRCVQHRQP
ncbi:uncharacterized protein LOC113781466 isoform X2 [Coffea eugenioides]|uniref:uncharacterized protein LOC113754176 isoform X2 n=1 Tax=Coffea eugenioides TaxID=49369 RepID=UPI000F605FD6|nr:uncharacterized protein LOC113754176 isoform X2 [Coffea eugenioides]XP_027183209.1 uncharacterized protein LOC113781466 isoform X2 [Coffea eugenioides]